MIIGPDPTPRDLTGLALVAHISTHAAGAVGDPYPWWVTEHGSTIDTGYCNVGHAVPPTSAEWERQADELLATQHYERVGLWTPTTSDAVFARVRALS